MPIELTSTVIRTETSMTAPMDDDLVVVSLESNAYITLDAIGRQIWDLLETPQRVDALCERLSEMYEGASEQITADVVPFLLELESAGLVHAANPDAA